jgi:parvulin-like peptidyl-prolyl isomerase
VIDLVRIPSHIDHNPTRATAAHGHLFNLATITRLRMTKRKLIPALGAFFVLALGLAGCGSGVPGNSVADVAGNPITLQAFNHWMLVAAKFQSAQNPGVPVIVANDPPDFKQCIASVRKQIPSLKSQKTSQLRSDCNSLFKSYSGQVMNFLITAYWYQAEAARDHITVSDAQVQKAFNAAVKAQFPTPAQFQTFLTQTGQTRDDVIYRFRIQQVFSKLLAKQNTSVTQAQIQNYYKTHQSQFGTPQSRDIRIVLTNSQAQAQAAKSALQSGKGWDAVAKKYSIDSSTKNKGGLLTGVTPGSQDTALDSAAFSAASGKLEGPVKGQFGYYVFEVTKITKGTQQSLAQATPLIRQTLTAQAQNNAQSAVENRAKKHWLSKTQCRATYAMADCSGYKAPKTSTATSTTG